MKGTHQKKRNRALRCPKCRHALRRQGNVYHCKYCNNDWSITKSSAPELYEQSSTELQTAPELLKEYKQPVKVSSSQRAVEHLDWMRNKDREFLVVLLLNTHNEITFRYIVTIGTLNSSLVHPREVFKIAIAHSAAKIIIAHNHPGGDSTPSSADNQQTRKLVKAGKLLGIQVVDHIIVAGPTDYYSFNTMGQI